MTGQSEIQAYLAKTIGSKVTVQSVSLKCSGDIAYDIGTYSQEVPGAAAGEGKRVEGSYLVVLRRDIGKWLILAHASTAKP